MAAVAFGHASNTSQDTNATSTSWSHTCTGDDYLIVIINHRNDPGTGSATYNGTSMTLLKSQDNTFNFQRMYGLASPASGSNTIQCSWTNSVKAGAVGMSFVGVSSVGTATSGAPNAAGTITTGGDTLTANDMLVAGAGVPDYNNTIAVTTGTERAETNTPSPKDYTVNGATNTGTGSVTVAWSYTGLSTWIAVPLVGAASVTVVPDLRTYHYA